MKDQHGTALDMAKLLRDTGIKASDMEGLGISMSEAKTSDAAGMRELSPFLWKQLNTGQLPESWGVVLGREMPDDPAGQDEVYKQLAGKKYTTTQLADTIRLQRGSDVVSGGGGQGSFGGEGFDIKKTTLPQQVKILGEVRDTLTDTAKGMTGAAKGKAMLEAAGETKIDAPEMQKRAREARQVADLMPRFVYQSGSETNNVLKQLAYDLAEKPNEKNSIYEQARAKLPEAVKTDASRAGIEIGQAEPERKRLKAAFSAVSRALRCPVVSCRSRRLRKRNRWRARYRPSSKHRGRLRGSSRYSRPRRWDRSRNGQARSRKNRLQSYARG